MEIKYDIHGEAGLMVPLISVIIPTYNRENTITRSIDSVLNQNYENIELIIVEGDSALGEAEKDRDEYTQGKMMPHIAVM